MLLLFSYNSPQSRRNHVTSLQISMKAESSSNAGLIFFPFYCFQIQIQVKSSTSGDTARAPEYKATLDSSELVEI